MPVYNARKYLQECMDSLLSQTLRDMEIICVNDGSTDDSMQILGNYAARDPRIRIIDVPNGGYGRAMNIGMDEARGLYMAILEPDDYLPRHAYEALYAAACTHHLDIVKGRYTCFTGSTDYVHKEPNSIVWPGRVLDCTKHPEWFPELHKRVFTIWTALYRLDFLTSNHLRFHESPGASYQDTGWFCLTMAHAKRMMIIPDVVYHYRRDNPASSTALHNFRNKPLDVIHQEYLYTLHALSLAGVRQQKYMSYVFTAWVDSAICHFESLPLTSRDAYVDVWRKVLQASGSFLSPLERGKIRQLKMEIRKQTLRLRFSLPKVRSKRTKKLKRINVLLDILKQAFPVEACGRREKEQSPVSNASESSGSLANRCRYD